jgi:hypothetical protein
MDCANTIFLLNDFSFCSNFFIWKERRGERERERQREREIDRDRERKT